ncbi:MAG: alanine--tRNA ligase [Anaerolineae bacterium]|nr:alanine--tRNA ligase [Anaerolineae bacterium]
MQPMTSAEVRQTFLDFFSEMRHKIVASSSLVPANDPTLLFTNAGMVQFKDVFLGLDKRNYDRAATAQKCMRVSGKHNDLENVGPSPRHHTFFEMLGNFSFGAYFKREAIRYAYDLLTRVYGLPPERLAFTVYESDDEAYDIWVKEIGVDPRRVARMGPKTNFWQMAETGPCGPTSEIHWDRCPEKGIDSIIPDLVAEEDRFLELWNLVFMQFNRTQPDPDHTGRYDVPLPKPGVDTGMGLERIVSVLQGAEANYDTDLFLPIIARTQALAGMSDAERDANIVPFRVIADHMRAAAFLIADGVLPGAMGRDYICRMVIRRAARFGARLGFDRPFLADVAEAVIETMGGHYTELVEKREAIRQAITLEEERFRRTLDRGMDELEAALDRLESEGQRVLPGQIAFYLKATLGLPVEVIRDICQERGFQVDDAGFRAEEEKHILASGGGQAMGQIDTAEVYQQVLDRLVADGLLPPSGVAHAPYGPLEVQGKVLALIQNGRQVETAITGERVEVVLPATPFYVESGGQITDTGVISGPDDRWRIEVEEAIRPLGGLIVHRGEVVEGTPHVGDPATARVDGPRRNAIRRAHTATHLLHAALRRRLGLHVQQRGSLVAPDRLRFDFSHPQALTPEDLEVITREVNEAIMANLPVTPVVKPLEIARKEGAMALFGEKYSDDVRTITVGDPKERYSYELCGGTHVSRTSEIGSFLITSEGSAAAGIRRIDAVTGLGAAALMTERLRLLRDAAAVINAPVHELPERIQALQEELHSARREASQLRREMVRYEFSELLARARRIGETTVLAAAIKGATLENLRELADQFRDRNRSGVIALGTIIDGRPQLIVAVTEDLVSRGLHAGNLIKEIAAIVGGSGGGRPTLAQAGGKDAAKLDQALARLSDLVEQALR